MKRVDRAATRQRPWAAIALAGCLPLAQARAAAPSVLAEPATIIEQPRPFGYVLGDTLTQRILLQSAGNNFDPVALPPVERAGLWFARRSSRIERADDGHRWLVIDYQLINAPQTLMTVNLPSVTVKSKAGHGMLAVPEWPLSIAPLTPRAVFAKGGLQDLRLDHPAPTIPTLALRRRLQIWSVAFALTIVSWLGWWLVRSLRAAANQPFGRALHEIRSTGDGSAAAWLALHRAFDRTAGRALQLSTLPALFRQSPQFESQRSAIEQFYAESNLRFFGVTPAPGDRPVAAAPRSLSLRALCTILRRIEKQHER